MFKRKSAYHGRSHDTDVANALGPSQHENSDGLDGANALDESIRRPAARTRPTYPTGITGVGTIRMLATV